MSYGYNPPVQPSFYDGLMFAGVAMEQVPIALYQYAPYIFGYGFLNWMGDWVDEARPIGESEMSENFFKYTAKGVIDVAKQSYWGYTNQVGPSPPVKPMMGYPASTGWGSHMMGMANPGVNRVAGQY